MNEKETIQEVLKQVRRIDLILRRKSFSLFAGNHPSVFKGRGMTFSDFREYVPGDDTRSLSWSITAKTGRPHIKIFEEERESPVMLACDVSSSLCFGSGSRSKREALQQTAAFLAFIARKNRDPLGFALFDTEIQSFLPPSKDPGRAFHIVKELCRRPAARRKESSLEGAERNFRRSVKKGSRIFILSDFLFPFANPLKRLSLRYEILCLVIEDSRTEKAFPPLGLMDIEDLETGKTVTVDTAGSHFQKRIQTLGKERIRQRNQALARTGARTLFIDTQTDIYKPLISFLQQKRL